MNATLVMEGGEVSPPDIYTLKEHMAMTTPNPFAFLCRLPDAELSGVVEKSPGVNIDGAWSGENALVNALFGDNVKQTTYTIGLTGRGTLQMPEQEFRCLLSAMLAVFESRSPGFAAKDGPTSPSVAALPVLPADLTGQK